MLTIVTSIGNVVEEKRAAILCALERNLRNRWIDKVEVVTEDAGEDLVWLKDLDDYYSCKLSITHVSGRPDFNALVRRCNGHLADGCDAIALMNADVSFANDEDVKRVLDALVWADKGRRHVVFSLARHEYVEGRAWIDLYEPSGLPNTLSADAWIFRREICASRDLFYRLGQMNCDMMFAYDLRATGCKLYNPCLDVTLLHHEEPKDISYYVQKNLEDSSREALARHVEKNRIEPWNYFGVPWVKTDWLRRGYMPDQVGTNTTRVIVALSNDYGPADLERLIPSLDRLTTHYSLEVLVIYDGSVDKVIESNSDLLASRPKITLSNPKDSVIETRKAFLHGLQYSFNRVAFVSCVSRIDDAMMSLVDGVFVTLSKREVVPPPAFGCTLITSVFKSDQFLNGFVENSCDLVGYDKLVEHIFVTSTLSDSEIEILQGLMDEKSNVVVLWHREDPGLYECWNRAIRMARTDYVSNANVDDLRHPKHLVTLLRRLEANPAVAVGATAIVPFYDYPTDNQLPGGDEVWYRNRTGRFGFEDLGTLIERGDESVRLEPNNIPHCMPVWRRSLHSNYGWFDEDQYGTYADWAFWLKVFERGEIGWLEPEGLSFYFVNPESHNRRGTMLQEWHRRIEEKFVPSFESRSGRREPIYPRRRALFSRKLHLRGQSLYYGQHRNSFGNVVRALSPLDKGAGGVRFVPFIERQFVWGASDEEGEAASRCPKPISEPWIGILHVPFGSPPWFEERVMPERVLESRLFRDSLAACEGLITFSGDLQRELLHRLPSIRTVALRHPTELCVATWSISAYMEAPCVVQVGDWLRRLQAIHKMRAPRHRRVMLLKKHTVDYLAREVEVFGDYRDRDVEVRAMVSDAEYDGLLSRSVVLCLMYATAANNVVVECIARATPILINPLPAAIEYLGVDYPLYVHHEDDADRALLDCDRIVAAHEYLVQRRKEIDLSYEGLCRNFSMSGFYRDLSVDEIAMA